MSIAKSVFLSHMPAGWQVGRRQRSAAATEYVGAPAIDSPEKKGETNRRKKISVRFSNWKRALRMPTNENSRLPGRTSPEPACFRRRVSQGRGPKEAWRRKGRTSELLSLTRRVFFCGFWKVCITCQKLLHFPKALQTGVPHSVPFCLFTGWTPQNGAFRHSSWLSFAAKTQKSDTPNCLLRQAPPALGKTLPRGAPPTSASGITANPWETEPLCSVPSSPLMFLANRSM